MADLVSNPFSATDYAGTQSAISTGSELAGNTQSQDTPQPTTQTTGGDVTQSAAYNSLIMAADAHNIGQTGNSGLLDKAEDWVTKGIPSAVGAGLVSLANSGISVANAFGADAQHIKTQDVLNSLDNDLGQYYQQHQQGADLAGDLLGSLIPGGAAVGVLKLAKLGKLGSNIASLANLAKNTQDAYLTAAKADIATGTVFDSINANKMKAILAGAADQALTASTFELGSAAAYTVAPMMDDPTKSKLDMLTAFGKDMATATILGGAIGGGLEYAGVKGILNKFTRMADKDNFPFRQVQDTGLIGNTPGDRASFLYHSMQAAPQPAPNMEQSLLTRFRNLVSQSQKTYQNTIQKQFLDMTPDKDAALADGMIKGFINNNTSADNFANTLGKAVSITRIGEEDESLSPAASTFFKAKGSNVLTSQPQAPEDLQYILRNGAKIGKASDYANLQDATEAGLHFLDNGDGTHTMLTGNNGQLKLRKLPKLTNPQLIMNLNSGDITNTAYATVGDLSKDGVKISKDGSKLVAGDNIYKLDLDGFSNNLKDMDATTAQAHFAAAQLLPKLADGVEIQASNLPMLEKAALQPELKNVTVLDSAGNDMGISNLADFVTSTKKDLLANLITDGRDIDEAARMLNTTPDWAATPSGVDGSMLNANYDVTKPLHAKITYAEDGPTTWDMKGIADVEARIAMRQQLARNVTASFFGNKFPLLPQLQGNISDATRGETRQGFLNFADGNYGGLLSQMQQAGKVVTDLIRTRHQGNMDALASYQYKIATDPQMLAEFNGLVSKLRGSTNRYTLSDDANQMLSGVGDQEFSGSTDTTLWSDKYSQAMQKYQDSLGSDAELEMPEATEDDVIHVPYAIAQYLDQHIQINDARIDHFTNFANAQGLTSNLQKGMIYVPPIDTSKQPFVAFVREVPGKINASSSVATLNAPSAQALENLIQQTKNRFGDAVEVYTKNDTEMFHKLQGDYDYDMGLNNNIVDSSLKKNGILSSYVPRTDDYIFNEFNNWNLRSEQRLVRNMTELHYSQEFAELQHLGDQATDVATSQFGRVNPNNDVDNPYNDYIRTALGLGRGNSSAYNLWTNANEKVAAFGDKAFSTFKDMFNLAKQEQGGITYEDANKAMAKYGINMPYADAYNLALANSGIPKPVLAPLVQKMNAALTNTVLRMDMLETIRYAVSMPVIVAPEVKSIVKNAVAGNSDLVGDLTNLTHVAVPGTQGVEQLLSPTKLITNAIKNYFQRPDLVDTYKSWGIIRNGLDDHRALVDMSAIQPGSSLQELKDKASKMVELGAKLSGNNWSHEFTRFISANVMHQITQTAGIADADAQSYINTFVNRCLGNYTASQRPLAFQGVIGHALSLFQTYQANLMQQAMRFVENGDKKAAAMMLGLNNSIYGLQSSPGWYALNSHIASTNSSGDDLISGTYKVVGKEAGDWLMYGLAANALHSNIYTRGDLTPHHALMVPTNLSDIPIVSATSNFAQNIYGMMRNITQGGGVVNSLLDGLSHMNINRPLAGIAQLAAGRVTSSSGNLNANLSALNDYNAWGISSRLMGGKPLDEAIALDALYRTNQYKATQHQDLDQLGQALKTKLYGDGQLSQDDVTNFVSKYAAAGGDVKNFNSWMVRNTAAAKQSKFSQLQAHMRDQNVRNMLAVMGGDTSGY